MSRPWRLGALVALLLLWIASVGASGGGSAVDVPLEGDLPRLLSDYHLFEDAWLQVPAAGVLPYGLNNTHFADYATLGRFIWMPTGTSAVYGSGGSVDYPKGTALVLTVGFPRDQRRPDENLQLVETRILIYRPEGWVSAQYVWDTDGSEARLTVAGRRVELDRVGTDGEALRQALNVPNRNQCKMCHEVHGQFIPLGPARAADLNRSYSYDDGVENQLVRWTEVGYLKGAPTDPASAPRSAVWNDPATGTLDERARAYLDMNRSSCHRPGGLAFTSGLDLTVQQTNPTGYGVYKAPVAAGRGGSSRFGIVPGDPQRSILIHRVRSTDPGVRMPVVGRSRVHAEGVALLEEWVTQMSFPDLKATQEGLDRDRKVQRQELTNMKSRPAAPSSKPSDS